MSRISFPSAAGAGGGGTTIPTFAVDTPAFAWFGFHPSGQSGVAWRASPPSGGDSVLVAVSQDDWSTSGIMTDSLAASGNNRTAQGHTLLDADTAYKYRVLNNGDLITSGVFTTAAESGVQTDFSVIFGSCQSGFVYDNPLFNSASGEGATLFLHLGDLGYFDIANVVAQAASSRQLFTPESTWVSGIVRKMMWAGVWDDHDFGGNNEDRLHNGIQTLASGWKNFFPHNKLPDTSGALYRKFTYGDVEFFMLDQRFWRDRNVTASTKFPTNYPDAASGATNSTILIDPSGSPSAVNDFYNRWYVDVSGVKSRVADYVAATQTLTLERPITDLYPGAAYTLYNKSMHDGGDSSKGGDQVKWLGSGILNSNCTWKVIVSPTTWNPTTAFGNNDPFSEHDADDNEYLYLVQMLSGVANNVIMVEGDTHFGAIDDGTTSPFPTVMAGPLQAAPAGGSEGVWSEGDTTGSGILNYGKIDFSATQAVLSVIQESGHVAISKVISNASMMDVNDPSISGELRWWFREDSIGNFPLGQSGASSWDNIQGTDQILDVNSPGIASGEINGIDAMYFNGANKHFGEGSPQTSQMTPFQGSNKPFTVIIVARPDVMATQAMWSMSNVGSTTDSQLVFHLHSAGGMYILKRADTGGANSQIWNFPNNYVPGDVAVFTFQTSADGTEMQFYRDGVEISAGPSGLISNVVSPPDVGIGVFWRPDKDNDFVGMIGEIAVYSSGLQDTDRAKVEQNLMNKWGIS